MVIPDESSVSMTLPFKVKLPNCIDEALVAITAVLAAPKALTVVAVVFNKLNIVLSVVISPPRTIKSPRMSVSAVTTRSPVPFGLMLISELDVLPSMLFWKILNPSKFNVSTTPIVPRRFTVPFDVPRVSTSVSVSVRMISLPAIGSTS